MENTVQAKEQKALTGKLTAKMIAEALDSEAAHTSFGKLPLAAEHSGPIYSFGTGTRDSLNKVFYSEELNAGAVKHSPGPKYDVHDNINFKQPPEFSLGKDERVTLGKPQHYDHYSIVDGFSDPIRAKNYTHKSTAQTKFSTESRMPPPDVQGTPGPQYYPPLRPEIPSAPQFTLGARRNNPGGSAIENLTSTPGLVGPSRYYPGDSSVHRTASKWSFGSGDQITKPVKSVTKHQTYDYKSAACGTQANSRKKTAPTINFGRASRDQVSKLGMFRGTMSTQTASIRIPHPKF